MTERTLSDWSALRLTMVQMILRFWRSADFSWQQAEMSTWALLRAIGRSG